VGKTNVVSFYSPEYVNISNTVLTTCSTSLRLKNFEFYPKLYLISTDSQTLPQLFRPTT